MKKLLSVVENYRFDTQHEVDQFIEDSKAESVGGGYILSKYSTALKEKKAKGEIIDTGFLVTIVKDYNQFFND